MTPRFAKAFYWPGAKWWMRFILSKYVPPKFDVVRIPFFGRGDFLQILRMDGFAGHAVCSDLNPRIVDAHAGIRDFPDEVIKALEVHEARHSYDYYIQVRSRSSTELPAAEKAANTVYLSRSTYKGILKQNAAGEVTTCSARDRFVFDREAILSHSRMLRNTTLASEDFAATMMAAKPGELAVADPSYLDSGVHGALRFTPADQIRLANACRRLHRLGIHFLVTNSDEPFIRGLYREFVITPVEAPRVLGWARNGGKATELVITNF